MRCDIIIPVWNQPDATSTCLEHLVRNTGFPYRLILIDNASDEPTREYLENVAGRSLNIKLIRNRENLGFVKAVNQGLKVADSPYVCLMNNDTVPAPGWLGNMVEFAEDHRDMGLLNPLCNGHGERSIEEYARVLDKNKGRFMEMNQCFGFCMLIKREVIEKIGVLDENFGIGGFDDTDYSMRAHKAGYRCAAVYSSYVYHKEHVSFDAMGDRKSLVSKGESEYFKKWPSHLRVGIGVTVRPVTGTNAEIESLLMTALYLAREWCWVNLWIFGDKAASRARIERISRKIGMPLHQNIKFNYLPEALIGAQLAVRLVERSFGPKRRKRYDFLLVDNVRSRFLLERLYPIHRTAVYLINMKRDLSGTVRNIISELRDISKNAQRTTHNGQRI